MKKSILLGLSLLMVQLCFSNQDSTKYPIIVDSGQVVKTKVVAFLPNQAKKVAENIIQLDNCQFQDSVNQEIIMDLQRISFERELQRKQLNRQSELKDLMLSNKDSEIKQYKTIIKQQKLKFGFALAGVGTLTIALPIIVFAVLK